MLRFLILIHNWMLISVTICRTITRIIRSIFRRRMRKKFPPKDSLEKPKWPTLIINTQALLKVQLADSPKITRITLFRLVPPNMCTRFRLLIFSICKIISVKTLYKVQWIVDNSMWSSIMIKLKKRSLVRQWTN